MKIKYLCALLLAALTYSCDDTTPGIGDTTIPDGDHIQAGGKIYVCTPCMKKRGIAETNLIAGATPAGGAALVEWLSAGSPCVVY